MLKSKQKFQNVLFVRVPNQKQFKDKHCGTTEKIFVDRAAGPNVENVERKNNFSGFASVKTEEQLLDLWLLV